MRRIGFMAKFLGGVHGAPRFPGRRCPRLLPLLFATAMGAAVTVATPAPSRAAFVGRQLVASGLSAPMFAAHVPGDPTRLFIAERGAPNESSTSTATIRVLDLTTNTLLPTPFLSIPAVDNRGEGGLLGMAFHPDYATNGKFYVYVTAADSDPSTYFTSYIREYTSPSYTSNVANTAFKPVLSFGQPQSNHNGGWIGFSPNDDYLYIMSGDGGSGNDQGAGHVAGGNAQAISNNLLGKALRIDVDGDDFASTTRNYRIPDSNPFADVRNAERVVVTPVTGDDEIWAYGLRNPFRAGFDRATGDLWIGDVGQSAREEIDFQPGDSDGGENYGWRLREGFIATPGVGGTAPAGAVDPIYDYKRPEDPTATADFTGTTVVGGVPYRGPDPSLQGLYFFADTSTNRIWTLRRPAGTQPLDVDLVNAQLPVSSGSPSQPVAISEDAVGNIYFTYLTGQVYRMTTNLVTAGDFNADAMVDAADLAVWQTNFGRTGGATRSLGDADGDGDVDGNDLTRWQRNLGWSARNVGAPAAAVPEPGAAAMIAALACAFAARRGKRRT